MSEEPDALDAFIEAAAQSLTQAEPPASLRRRVHASISSPPPRRVHVRLAATAAVFALSSWWLMRDTPVTPRSEDVPVINGSAARVVNAPRDEPAPIARAAQSESREPQRPPPTISAERGTPVTDRLPVIEPIEIEPMPSSAIAAIERIPVPAPLLVDAITIERLFE
jgi:hypothetical protein